VVQRLLLACGELSYFAVHKLFYLLEYEHYRQKQRRFSACYIVRQKDGPYVTDLNIKKLKKALPDLETWSANGKLMLSLTDATPLLSRTEDSLGTLPASDLVADVAQKYGHLSDAKLKQTVYVTAPMRHMLRREKYHGENLFNAAIDFSLVAET
jgi:hypothetical protein